jgi:AcrR family transcriptional regulator
MSPLSVAVDDPAAEIQTVPERRRAQIVETAIRLFSKRGYFQTTTEDIANEIQVSKGLVYRYFKDKNELLFFCMQYVIERYRLDHVAMLVSKGYPLRALLEVTRIQGIIAKEHTVETVLAYRSTGDLSPELARQIKILESKTVRTIQQCLDGCIHLGYMINIDTNIMAYQYIMFGHTWALKNWSFRDRYSVEEYMSKGEEILLKPFLTADGLAELKRCKETHSISSC